jgi:hypothetical protein
MFTQEERDEADSLLNTAPASFAEQIVVFKNPLEVISNESSYNFAFAGSRGEITYTPQSGTFTGTVEYTDQQDNQYIKYNPSDSLFAQPKGYVRLSLSGAEAREFLRDAQVIKLDGMNLKPASDLVFRGLFDREVWTDCWLNKIDNGKV